MSSSYASICPVLWTQAGLIALGSMEGQSQMWPSRFWNVETNVSGSGPKPSSTSGFLTQEHLVAVKVLEKNARTPWARLRLPVKNDPASLQGLVITDAIGSIHRQKWEAASLLAHNREVVGILRQLEREHTFVVWQ